MKVTRVLIVDDSPSLRRLIRAHLMADPRVEVIGEACDPYEAREKIKDATRDAKGGLKRADEANLRLGIA